MNDLIHTSFWEDYKFDKNGYWSNPIPEEYIDYDFIESNKCVYLMDQNGYDLSPLEIEYYKFNNHMVISPKGVNEISELNCHIIQSKFPELTLHRNFKHISLQKPWFSQKDKLEGYVLNHSMLLERKGYDGAALEQLKKFAKRNPLINKVINISPKWGIDFSLDYTAKNEAFGSAEYTAFGRAECEAFEILHFEWDSFNYDEVERMKYKVETIIKTTDFNKAAKELLERKNEWVNLEFFEQSHYKTSYFHLPDEKFKIVIWK